MGETYRVEEIEELKPLNTKDVLAIAWKSEVTARKMYRSFIEKSDDVPSDSILKELLEEEKIHEKKIIDMFHDFYPNEEPKGLDPEKVVFSERVEKKSNTFGEILKLAKSAEKKEEKFYHMLSKIVEDHSASRLLSYLAYEENEHYEKLKSKISERGQ